MVFDTPDRPLDATTLLAALRAVRKGDFGTRLPLGLTGISGEISEALNDIIEWNERMLGELERAVAGARDGKLEGHASPGGAAGGWGRSLEAVNALVRELARDKGDLAALKADSEALTRALADSTRKNAESEWLKANLAAFTAMIQGQPDAAAVAKRILSELATALEAHHGVFYALEGQGEDAELHMIASYAQKRRKGTSARIAIGDGLAGQCAVEKSRILLTNVPSDYIQIASGLGQSVPANILVLPVLFEGEVTAVLELASLNAFSDLHIAFLEQLAPAVGVVLDTHELRRRQEELKEANDRLEEQAAALRHSEEQLRSRQEELSQTNAQLEEKATLLSEEKAGVEAKNREVEVAKSSLEEKAEQLALTSKYKSQFLANMSHELRTPLNSLLILARLLADNERGNLDEKQVEFSRTIYAAGSDLLALINEILDLSKIESGTMAIDLVQLSFDDLRDYVEPGFSQIAEAKHIAFRVLLDESLPAALQTDVKRLQQVLKNLLSNAFKFTSQGSVTLKVALATSGWSLDRATLQQADSVIAFSVSDTGIGIQPDKQGIIFEAFQQADMSTSRKFGGTGLGLSISREIAQLLGGELRVDSKPGVGSTFTLYLPQPCPANPATAGAQVITIAPRQALPEVHVEAEPTALLDDRDACVPGDRTILLIEDDRAFAGILVDMAREHGFKALVAERGDQGVAMARHFQPDVVILDLQLPDTDGWTVLEGLKEDESTRDIPVHVATAADARNAEALRLGAASLLEKPVSAEALDNALQEMWDHLDERVRRLLVVEDDDRQRQSILDYIATDGVQGVGAKSGEEALDAIRQGDFDCMILDLGLPDMTGRELVTRIRRELGKQLLPIIVYTGRDLTDRDEAELRTLSETIIIKDARSPERLRDEAWLFLRKGAARPVRTVTAPPSLSGQLENRRVLIVDDDIRNIFALTSVLEREKMIVRNATSGAEAIQLIQNVTPDIEVVLMDIMMPGMDGYEAMRAVRALPRFRTTPIIALTAKAMKGDREKCLAAGASDYVPKPVDAEQLLSLLRMWLEA